MADWRTRHRSARAEFDVLLQYNGSSHTGQDAMAADQQDKELALDIAKLLCCLLESRNFKVFLPYRDTMPGMCKFDAMQESLQNCKVVVVVFTPGFRLCHWEEYKQKYAFADFLEERRSWRLIPVCVGHPSRTLPDCLRHHGVAELTENCESDSTQLEILLDSVAEAVHKISSPPVPSNLDQSNQASLTSSSSPCAPTYIRDVTSLVAKAFPEICSPETKPVSSQSSSTQLKQPCALLSPAS